MSNTTHSQAVQFTLNANSLAVRVSTWQTLCANHAHVSWPPHLIDHVLNEVTDSDASFQELCHIAADAPLRKCQLKKSVTAEALLIAPFDAGRTLLSPFLQWVARKVASKKNISPTRQLREETEELVTTNYLQLAAKFRPFGERDGHIVTYGFEAFQMVRSKKAIQQVDRILHHHTPLSLDAEQSTTIEPSYALPMETTPEQMEIRQHVIHALRLALSEPRAWQMVHLMAYQKCTQGEVAHALGLSRQHASGAVATKIKEKLQRHLARAFDLESGQSASVAAISKALAGIFEESEFCMLIPRPTDISGKRRPPLKLPVADLVFAEATPQPARSNIDQSKATIEPLTH